MKFLLFALSFFMCVNVLSAQSGVGQALTEVSLAMPKRTVTVSAPAESLVIGKKYSEIVIVAQVYQCTEEQVGGYQGTAYALSGQIIGWTGSFDGCPVNRWIEFSWSEENKTWLPFRYIQITTDSGGKSN